ncbi:MAG: hypothetical protein K1X28_04310 [Parachlamydiales bacterium]|nr:hypothetical protein [Parachlamydiales bacterium]
MIKKVQYIDFPKFLTGLGYSIKAAADQIDFSNRHTAIGIVPGKSNEWVTALAFKCCKALSRFPCFNIAHNGRGTLMQSMGASISQKKFNDLPSQFIVIDDGSYSGLQLFNHVTSIVDTIQHKAKEGTKIILIVPYMTNAALQRLKAIEMPANISLVIADHVPIQTIKESMEVEDYDLLRDMFPEQITEDDSGITLTCFQHKVPNGQSFFAPVAQLLSDIETPYKGKDDSKTEDGK